MCCFKLRSLTFISSKCRSIMSPNISSTIFWINFLWMPVNLVTFGTEYLISNIWYFLRQHWSLVFNEIHKNSKTYVVRVFFDYWVLIIRSDVLRISKHLCSNHFKNLVDLSVTKSWSSSTIFICHSLFVTILYTYF